MEKWESPALFAGLFHSSTDIGFTKISPPVAEYLGYFFLPFTIPALQKDVSFAEIRIGVFALVSVKFHWTSLLYVPENYCLSVHKIHYSSFVTLLLRTLSDAQSLCRLLF